MSKVKNISMPICNLCLDEKDALQKESHIIPKLFFRHIRKEQGEKVKKFTSQDVKEGTSENGEIAPEEYEHDILCSDCDQGILNEGYEDYSAKCLNDRNLSNSKKVNIEGRDCISPEKAEAGRVKLFFLSILWRASISGREVYEEIQLPEDQEEKLRKMIYYNDSGSDNDFPLSIYTYRGTDVLPESGIFKPVALGDGRFLFILNGFIINIDTQNKALPSFEVSGSENGLRIWEMTPEETLKLIGAYLGYRPR